MDEDRFETGRTALALTEELVREVEAEKLEVASLQQALQKAKHEARKIDSNRTMWCQFPDSIVGKWAHHGMTQDPGWYFA